jgi:hypothetical protein
MAAAPDLSAANISHLLCGVRQRLTAIAADRAVVAGPNMSME